MRTTLLGLGPKVSLAALPLKPATLKGSGAPFVVTRHLGRPETPPPQPPASQARRGEREGALEHPVSRPPRPACGAGGQGGGVLEGRVDPALVQAAHLAPPQTTAVPQPALGVRVSVEDLLPALVRKVAWSGDGRRGTVRLELGSGAEVVVASDEGRVTVHLRAPPGVDLDGWRARLGARLAARGLDVLEID